jgi:hypothetical protein
LLASRRLSPTVLGLAWVALAACGRTLPTENPTAGFILERVDSQGVVQRLEIKASGSGCEQLQTAQARETCVLATNLSPSVIGSSAFGRLNSGRTPAMDAIIWRGRLSGGPQVCAEAGLEGSLLEDCETEVEGEYRLVDGDGEIWVPRGPSP